MENYFELLEIDASASRDVIRKAYYKKLKKYHPDIYKGDKSFASDVVAELNKAYAIFKDDELKYRISKEYSGYKYRPITALTEDERTRYAMDNIAKYRQNAKRQVDRQEKTTNVKSNVEKTEHEDYSIVHGWINKIKSFFAPETTDKPKLTQEQQEKIDKFRLNLIITFIGIIIVICMILLFVL